LASPVLKHFALMPRIAGIVVGLGLLLGLTAPAAAADRPGVDPQAASAYPYPLGGRGTVFHINLEMNS